MVCSRRVVVLLATFAIAASGASLACSGGDDGDPALPGGEALRIGEDLPELPLGEGGGGGGCAAVPGSPDAASSEAPPGSPFETPGARQVPGPATTVTTIPTAPVSVVVVSPSNPDLPSAAAQPSGTGSPTPTYVAPSAPPEPTEPPTTTAGAEASTTTVAAATCEPGL